jgi:hypothetical protein
MYDFTFSRWQILPAEPLSIIARRFIRVEWPGKSSLANGNIDLSIPFEWRRISDDIQSDYELLLDSSKNRIMKYSSLHNHILY